MRTALLLTFVLMVGASLAFGQNGNIAVFADAAGADCNLSGAPGLLCVYFVHVGAVASAGVDFAAPKPACVNGVWLYDIHEWPISIENTQNGITVIYETCESETFLIVTAAFQVVSAATCCQWPIVPTPGNPLGSAAIRDCGGWGPGEGHWTPTVGWPAVVNADPTCICNLPVDNAPATWGRVKALYSE